MSKLKPGTKVLWCGMFAGILLMLLLGALKVGITGNIRVDHNPFPVGWGYPVFIAFVLAMFIFSISFWNLIWKNDLQKPNYRIPVYLVLVLSSCMMPFLSNDVIIYLGHGWLSNHSVDVFSNTQILKNSVWAPYIDDWKDGPFVYGPINLIPAKLANYLGGNNIWLTFISYKILMLFVGVFIIEILIKIIKHPKDLLIAAMAPMFWLHNVGHMHNDLIAALFVLAAVYFVLNKQIISSAIFIGIALSCKVSIALYVPFIFTLYFFTSEAILKSKIVNVLFGIVALIAAVLSCYAIYWTGTSSIEVPFKYLSKQQSTKTFAEILGEILNVIFSGLNKENIQSEVEMEALPTNDPKQYWLSISKSIFNVIGLVMFVITGIIFAIKTKMKFSKEQVIELFIKFNFIFFFYYLHIFQAWYLILLVPLIVISSNIRIKKYFMILCCYSGIHTIIITIARPSALYYVLPALVIINCALFLWQFKRNFLLVES